MWPFTEEFLNRKLHFLCSVNSFNIRGKIWRRPFTQSGNHIIIPPNIYLFKVNKRKTRKKWKKCSNVVLVSLSLILNIFQFILTYFKVNFEHISRLWTGKRWLRLRDIKPGYPRHRHCQQNSVDFPNILQTDPAMQNKWTDLWHGLLSEELSLQYHNDVE